MLLSGVYNPILSSFSLRRSKTKPHITKHPGKDLIPVVQKDVRLAEVYMFEVEGVSHRGDVGPVYYIDAKSTEGTLSYQD